MNDQPGLLTVLRDWGRIGCTGFGGPPAHIRLLRQLCVERRKWLDATEFEDAMAACNLLPGPASTQLAIFCAWRVRGRPGALVGGIAFIVPGLIVILLLSWLFLAGSPPLWVRGAGAGPAPRSPRSPSRRARACSRRAGAGPPLPAVPGGWPTWPPGLPPRPPSARGWCSSCSAAGPASRPAARQARRWPGRRAAGRLAAGGDD